MRLILGSASPRRADLLRAAGYAFDTMSVDADESTRAGEPPAEYVRRVAMAKSAMALSVVSGFSQTSDGAPEGGPYKEKVILAADTAVVVDNEILGKPSDDRDSERMLRLLSGRAHEVLTGISLRQEGRELGRVITTTVWFRVLSDADISWYVRSGEGRGKAGAYAIQGRASRFVPRIEGSYANVVGLPVADMDQLLQQLRST